MLTGARLDIVAVDVLSGLPATPDGKKYILVLVLYEVGMRLCFT